MINAIGAWLTELIAANREAVAVILLLTVCAVIFGIGSAYRDRMTRWWSTSIRAAGLLMGVVVVAVQVRQSGWLVDVDKVVTDWLVGHRSPVADQIALAVTNVFGPAETACAAVLVAMLAAVRFRSRVSGLIVIAAVGGASALCTALKLLLARARPPVGIQETLETDYSFPSGHVTGTVALFGMLVLVVGMHRSDAVRSWLTCAAVIVIAAVALSRLYLGVHWLTDVLAGMLIGSAAVAIGVTALCGFIDRNDARTSDHTVRPQRGEILQ
jgi:membrane-associated phospholipid phosphatase